MRIKPIQNKSSSVLIYFVISDLNNYKDIVCALSENVGIDREVSYCVFAKYPKIWFESKYNQRLSRGLKWCSPKFNNSRNGFQFFFVAALRALSECDHQRVVVIDVGTSITTSIIVPIGCIVRAKFEVFPYILAPTKLIASDIISGNGVFNKNWRNRWNYKRFILQASLDFVGNIFATGFFINANHLSDNYTFGKPVNYLPNPISVDNIVCQTRQLEPSNHCIKLYYAGRIEPAKGIADAISVLSKSTIKKLIHFKLIGKLENHNQEWFEKIRQGAGFNIEQIDQLEKNTYLSEVSNYDGIVFFSHYEGAARVIDEANALGKYLLIRDSIECNSDPCRMLKVNSYTTIEKVDDFLLSILDAKSFAIDKITVQRGRSTYRDFVLKLVDRVK